MEHRAVWVTVVAVIGLIALTYAVWANQGYDPGGTDGEPTVTVLDR